VRDLMGELDDAAIAAGHECYCGRPPDACEDAGGCLASREIGRLRAALRRHQHKLTDSKGECCAGCLCDWPCPDAALLGENQPGGKPATGTPRLDEVIAATKAEYVAGGISWADAIKRLVKVGCTQGAAEVHIEHARLRNLSD